MKLLIMQFSPFSCNFIPFNPSHLSQTPIHKHPLLMFLCQNKRFKDLGEIWYLPHTIVDLCSERICSLSEVEDIWNVMAHAQKQDFVFERNGRVHLNRLGCQFSWLLAAEVWSLAVVMLDTPCSDVVRRVLSTHFIRQFPLYFPSPCPRPCVTVCHHIPPGVQYCMNCSSVHLVMAVGNFPADCPITGSDKGEGQH
jgi:hypothetical protein